MRFVGWLSKVVIVLIAATSYQVSVKTADVRMAGTDANVHLKIFGDKGDTGTLHLKNSEGTKNKFERGRTDVFRLEASDIGKVETVVTSILISSSASFPTFIMWVSMYRTSRFQEARYCASAR